MQKKNSGIVALAAVAAVSVTFGAMQNSARAKAKVESQIKLGYELAPVPLDLKGKNVNLVGLGSYIVNAAGDCNDCHTNPPYTADGNPYFGQPKKINAANYMGGGVDFFGILKSPNISPDANGLPAGHTYHEFVGQMQEGTEHHHQEGAGGAKEQFMPWPAYHNMTELDIRAVYEYLRAIPHAEPGASDPRAPKYGRAATVRPPQ